MVPLEAHCATRFCSPQSDSSVIGFLENGASPIRIDSGLLRKGAFLRIFIFSQPDKNWRAQFHSAIGSFMRPLRKFDLCYSLRFQPVHVSRIHFAVKRTAIDLQFFKQLPYLFEHRLVESGSRLPYMNKSPLLVV